MSADGCVVRARFDRLATEDRALDLDEHVLRAPVVDREAHPLERALEIGHVDAPDAVDVQLVVERLGDSV